MYWIEIIGTFAFAISGIRLAAAKQFDLFGLFIVGFVTAVGGGTIRDVMLGVRPFWFDDLMSLLIVAGALVIPRSVKIASPMVSKRNIVPAIRSTSLWKK